MTGTHLMGKFHPSICSPIQTHCAENCIQIPLLVGFPIPPHLPLMCFQTAGTHTDGSRGSTRYMGNAFLFHLFQPQPRGNFQGGVLGEATATPKTSCIPRIQAIHLPASAQRTQPGSQKSKEHRRSTWQAPELHDLGSSRVFSRNTAHIFYLVGNSSPRSVPSLIWWASGPFTKAHNDWNYS